MALTRILGVLTLEKVELQPLDRLTKPILRELQSSEIYDRKLKETKVKVLLGSVLVSGATLNAAFPSFLDLHFFEHIDSPIRGQKPTLLFWLPREEIDDKQQRYERIGKTATIAQEGWKSFELPRFDHHLKCIGTRHPKETYEDWQSLSPIIVKSGHWAYEGHHDFITVNIANAVEAAFYAKNELARFLISNILPFIGIEKSLIDTNWQRLLESNDEGGAQKTQTMHPHGLLVYRSHPSSDSIITKLIAILTPKGQKIALSRIFPILPVRMRWNNSTFLIPPIVRENIKKALKTQNQPRAIMLFDDAAITGRTLQDLKAALSALGANKIETLIIANRLRQPAEGYGKERLNYYWRIDVPEMGKEGNCPLCHALNLIESFLASLSSSNAKKEIEHILNRWNQISPLDNWSVGLKPLLLGKYQKETNYSYRLDLEPTTPKAGKHLSKIKLYRSTGLSIHITELHAMTGRDDYCLKKISEHQEPEIKIEIAASQILLFGNEFDVDIRYQLIETLIHEVPLLKENSQHAELAILSIIFGIRLLDKEARKQVAKTVTHTSWDNRLNYISKILIAYFVAEYLIDQTCYSYKTGKSLLNTQTWSISHRFNSWYLETLSPKGNAHSETIPLLLDELSQPITIGVDRLKDAMDSIDFLSDIISSFEIPLVRKEISGSFAEKIETLEQYVQRIKKLINAKLKNHSIDNWKHLTKEALGEYIIAMKMIAEAFFHRIPSAKEYYKNRTFESDSLTQIIDRIDWEKASANKFINGKPVSNENRIIEFSNAGGLNFERHSEEVWIPWHRFIAGIVMDLFRNTVYASDQIQDPWDGTNNSSAHLWIKVDYLPKNIEISLINKSYYNSEKIFSKLKTHRWIYLKELGGLIEPVASQDSNLICLKIIIPYAAHLIL